MTTVCFLLNKNKLYAIKEDEDYRENEIIPMVSGISLQKTAIQTDNNVEPVKHGGLHKKIKQI